MFSNFGISCGKLKSQSIINNNKLSLSATPTWQDLGQFKKKQQVKTKCK